MGRTIMGRGHRAPAAPDWADPVHDLVHDLAAGDLDDPWLAVASCVLHAADADRVAVSIDGPDEVRSVVCAAGVEADTRDMVVPVRGTSGVRAVLHIGRLPGRAPYTDTDLALASLYAGQVGLALELAEGPGRHDHAVRTDERDRIARDLTVEVVGRLFALGLGLQGAATDAAPTVARRLREAADELDATIGRLRGAVYRVGPGYAGTASGEPSTNARWR